MSSSAMFSLSMGYHAYIGQPEPKWRIVANEEIFKTIDCLTGFRLYNLIDKNLPG